MFHQQNVGRSQGWTEDQDRNDQHTKQSFVLQQQPSNFLVSFDPGPLETTVHAACHGDELAESTGYAYHDAIIDHDWMLDLDFLATPQAGDHLSHMAIYFPPHALAGPSLGPYSESYPGLQCPDWLYNTKCANDTPFTTEIMNPVHQDLLAFASPSPIMAKNESTAVSQYSADNANKDSTPKKSKLQPRIATSAAQDNALFQYTGHHVGPLQHRTLVPGRRKINRKVGRACILCSEDKVKCNATDSPQPCHACFKRALFSKTIASRLCWRYNLKVWEVRKTVENFRRTSRDESKFITKDLPVTSRRQVVLCNMPVALKNGVRFSKQRLLVEVEDIDSCSAEAFDVSDTRGGDSNKLNTMINALTTSPLSANEATLLGYLDVSSTATQIEPSSLYRISEHHLNFIKDNIVQWSLNDLAFRSRYPPQTDQDALDFFLLAYVRHDPPLQMAELVKNTISAMAVCRHMVHESFVEIIELEDTVWGDGDSIALASLPKPARTQIFAIGLEKFQQIEALILHEIDRVDLRRLDGSGTGSCSDPLILGLCIRRIALWYRNLMFRYKNYGEPVVDRYRKGQKLYDMMTRHYCHVFRGTLSPFDEDWEQEKHAAALGVNAELVQAFEVFKNVEKEQCQRLHPEDDGVYLSLFVNRKNRKGKSLGKSAGLV